MLLLLLLPLDCSAKRRHNYRSTPESPGSLNHTRARRILVSGLPLSGASLFAASLLQIHHSVGVTDVDPNGPLPQAGDFNDVVPKLYIVLRVTPSERHSLSDYVNSFKPDVSFCVVRHPAQQLAALGVSHPGESFSRTMKNVDRSIQFKVWVHNTTATGSNQFNCLTPCLCMSIQTQGCSARSHPLRITFLCSLFRG